MSEQFSTLELIRNVRKGERDSSGIYKTERPFLDFVVDGVSLHEAIARERDFASVLWIDPPVPAEIEKCLRRLLLLDPADLPDGRVSLYICPECGDLGCGVISVDIKLRGDAIVWSKFGYHYDLKESPYTDSFQQIGPYQFELSAYRAVLLSALPANRDH